MRLGFAVFRRRGGEVFHFASEFDGFGPIPVISPRLRRILEQPSGNPPERPETQTHFGPPGGTAAPFAPQVGVLALAGAPPPVGVPSPPPVPMALAGAGAPPRTFALRGSGALRAAHLGAPVCIQKCAGAGQARFPGNPAVLFPEVPPLVPPWRPSLPGVAHKGGNKETPRGTQRRNQALVCDNVLRKSGPCVRNREQRAKREPHSHDNKLVGRSARGAARRSAEPDPGIPNRLGADVPRGAVEPSRILGGRPARARNRPGVRPGRYRPGPARRSRGGLRP